MGTRPKFSDPVIEMIFEATGVEGAVGELLLPPQAFDKAATKGNTTRGP
jgi:hypothetical protein